MQERKGMLWLLGGLALLSLLIFGKGCRFVHDYFNIETNSYPYFETLDILKPEVFNTAVDVTLHKLMNWKAWLLNILSIFVFWKIAVLAFISLDKIAEFLSKMWVLVLLSILNFIFLSFIIEFDDKLFMDFSSLYSFVTSLKKFTSNNYIFVFLIITTSTLVRIYDESSKLSEKKESITNGNLTTTKRKRYMFKGNSSISFKTTKTSEEVFDLIEEELSVVGALDISDQSHLKVNSSNYNGLFTKTSIDGTVRQKEDKFFVSIDYNSTLTVFGWIVLVVGVFIYGLGLLVLLAPGLTRGEIKSKLDRVLDNLRFQFKS